jgi:hypothetical protein
MTGEIAARASLLEDGGAGAADAAEFFRSPQFLAAEKTTHSLVIEAADSRQALPVLVREIAGHGRIDAISPYGYPGATNPPEHPPLPGQVEWSETGLVSVFVRDRIGAGNCLSGGTVRARVQVADPTRESGVRKRLREQIRRNERDGWTVGTVEGPASEESERAAFRHAYLETMARTGASGRYLFTDEYFHRVLGFDRSWLLLASRGVAKPSAGAIAAVSDGYLHYYLGGTADDALGDSPMKNLFAAMIELSAELGIPLSLGGGVTPGDSLEDFKRGFANAEADFRSHEVVCDSDSYRALCAEARSAPPGFFPAYRGG